MMDLGALELLLILLLPLSGLVAAGYLAVMLKRNATRDRADS